jgi:hypothetical protein
MVCVEQLHGSLEVSRRTRALVIGPLYIIFLYILLGIPDQIYTFVVMVYTYTHQKDCAMNGDGIVLFPYTLLWLTWLVFFIAIIGAEIAIYLDTKQVMKEIYSRYIDFNDCRGRFLWWTRFSMRQNHDGYLMGLCEFVSVNGGQNSAKYKNEHIEVLTLIRQCKYELKDLPEPIAPKKEPSSDSAADMPLLNTSQRSVSLNQDENTSYATSSPSKKSNFTNRKDLIVKRDRLIRNNLEDDVLDVPTEEDFRAMARYKECTICLFEFEH